ncbi:hypothetical protein AXG93_4666s1150 [Marchantia polymorpha subsp. ruderalis]|uniref:Uncharacterized protein n=1 Tax=Marchantia polymorpha subsp. ruderalis TaxID=1480154 RepID=A0A176W249_MARPO|nr:hypothetical protein AXG93_4666s1150 [Marchantia polymorpha subsp. ruderalis]
MRQLEGWTERGTRKGRNKEGPARQGRTPSVNGCVCSCRRAVRSFLRVVAGPAGASLHDSGQKACRDLVRSTERRSAVRFLAVVRCVPKGNGSGKRQLLLGRGALLCSACEWEWGSGSGKGAPVGGGRELCLGARWIPCSFDSRSRSHSLARSRRRLASWLAGWLAGWAGVGRPDGAGLGGAGIAVQTCACCERRVFFSSTSSRTSAAEQAGGSSSTSEGGASLLASPMPVL